MANIGATPGHITLNLSGEVFQGIHQSLIAARAEPVKDQAQTFKRCSNYLSGLALGAVTLLVADVLVAVRETYLSPNPVLNPMLKVGWALLGTGAVSGAAGLYCYQRNKKCQQELARLQHQFNLSENPSSPTSPLSPVAPTSVPARRHSNGRQALQV